MRLEEFLDKYSISQAEFARNIDAPAPYVNRWVKHQRRVSPRYCVRIEAATFGQVPCEELRPDIDWKAFLKHRRAK